MLFQTGSRRVGSSEWLYIKVTSSNPEPVQKLEVESKILLNP